jgi:thiamine biosynthesis lipoprotein ApbE
VESGVELVAVRVSSCLEADAWATGLIASGVQGAREIAQREGLTFWLLESAGGFSAPNAQGGKESILDGEGR